MLREELGQMDKKTLKALKGSIRHWKDNLKKAKTGRLTGNGLTSASCPLCVKFKSNCKNCLVFLRTGTEDCGGTPYYEVKDAVYDADQSDVIEACEAEVEFLESLLPEKKPVKKALK